MPSNKKKPLSPKRAKPVESVRQRAAASSGAKKQRRLRSAGTKIAGPLRQVTSTGRKEYYLPLPDNRWGRFLNKKRRFMPAYFRNAWQELKQVEWPGRKETAKLTFAVFLFAIFFMTIITIVDFVLDKIFKQLILN